MAKNNWVTVGSVNVKEKDGVPVGTYVNLTLEGIRVLANTSAKPGKKHISVQIQDPRKKAKKSLDDGKFGDDKYHEILAKIPKFVKFNLVLPPEQ